MYFISSATYYLMDEITSHLDQETCLKVYARLDEEVSEQNKCVVATSIKTAASKFRTCIRWSFKNK